MTQAEQIALLTATLQKIKEEASGYIHPLLHEATIGVIGLLATNTLQTMDAAEGADL